MKNTINYKKLYKEERRRFEVQINQLKSEMELQKKKIEWLEKRNAELERRDNYHDGPNTPANGDSLTRKKSRKMRQENYKPTGRKPGGQPGHKGTTRKFTIDRQVEHRFDRCPNCGSEDIHIVYTEKIPITEMPPPVKPETIEHIYHTYACDMCNAGKFTRKKHIPKHGEYGRSVMAKVVRNFSDRMPNRMNADRLEHDGLPMSNGTIQNILNRVADSLYAPAEQIKQLIQKCDILNVDETSARYNGKTIWLWTFHDPQTKTNYYLIKNSRGSDALKEVVGENHDITLVCDGWGPYKKYVIQRCNSHLIREIKTLWQKNSDYIPAKTAYETYQKIYHDAKSVLYRPPDERVKHHKRLTARVRRLIKRYKDDMVVGKFMAKLERAIHDIFRFVLNPRIPPTNNLAEQSLREYVIQRTIRGCLRSEKSMKRLGDMLTCITTWKNLGINYSVEAAKYV